MGIDEKYGASRISVPENNPTIHCISYEDEQGSIDFVKRMMPFADQIQLVHLKLQQVVAKMIPDGVFIDADGLNSVDLETVLHITRQRRWQYFQTGSVVGRSYGRW